MDNSEQKHKLDKVDLTAARSTGKVSLVRNWLKENFSIKVNSLDGRDIIIYPTDENPHTYEFDVSEADILLQAFEEDIPLTKSILDNILRSPNYSDHFNPLKEYLSSREGKFRGSSQLDMLVESLDIKDGENIKRLKEYIKKWFVGLAACAMGEYPNDVALGIVSDKAGIGKTTFFSEVIPFNLRKYTKIIIRSNNNILPSLFWTNNILVNLDELSALTSGTEDQFKMLMSSDTITIQERGSIRVRMVPRLASVCFTSNKTAEMGGFIRNNDGGILRRMAVIEVDKIEDYRGMLDVDQLWSEVMTLKKGGYDYKWNKKDYDFFIEYNKRYIMTTNALRLLRLYYDVPSSRDEIRYISSFDLLLEMHKRKLIPNNMTGVDEVSLGKALNQAGFKRVVKRIKGVGPRYVYIMKKH